MSTSAKPADTARTQAQPKPGLRSAPGVSAMTSQRGLTSTTDLVALALALIWIIGVGAFLLFAGGRDGQGVDATHVMLTLLALFMPPLLIWLAAAFTRSGRALRSEVALLRQTVLAMGSTPATDPMPFNDPVPRGGQGHVGKRSVEARLDDIARAQKQTEVALSTFISNRPLGTVVDPAIAIPDSAVAPDQTSLALGTPPDVLAEPLSTADFITAMNFPKNAEDAAGFRALRRALKDRRTSEVIQAAEDVLTLLSQDGIYMDDLTPDRARPEVWRKFGDGDRGRAVAALGGIRDRSSLALSAARMKQDPVFRDAVHHFLRRFDQAFSGFATAATDAEVAALAETRTARAFMLLGRVTGTFD
jgi:hypothetical protein